LPVLGIFERQADSLVTFFTCLWRFWSPIRLIGVLSFRFLDFSVTNTAHLQPISPVSGYPVLQSGVSATSFSIFLDEY
jgi:hypothetical protein